MIQDSNEFARVATHRYNELDFETTQTERAMAEYTQEYIRTVIGSGDKRKIDNMISDIVRIMSKEYGIVYAHIPEDIENKYDDNIPYPIYDKNLSLDANAHNGNMLLEGDNYIWLRILEQTHKGKVDIIYIDPPYNTGNKDFKYNDSFVDADDTFKHTKWLCFMKSRLRVARRLT